jgi:hypothetical protein
MSRPRLTIGTVGDITVRKVASGRFEARTRYRDWDGKTRHLSRRGDAAKGQSLPLSRLQMIPRLP